LAKARGGGVAPQTATGNALAAVRMAARLKTISLADAMAAEQAVLVAIGCDLLGMLGWPEREVFAAAAALPNVTTDRAQVVLPVAMAGELSGTYLLDGQRPVEVTALVSPPAGVPTPAELVGALASAAGVRPSDGPFDPESLGRLDVGVPPAAGAAADAPVPALLFSRQAMHAGCGALTAHGSWQSIVQELPELQLSADQARSIGVGNMDEVTVRSGPTSCRARVRVAPDLVAGVIVLPEGTRDARALSPCSDEGAPGMLVAKPVSVEVAS
jgi:anaerobic selenocysteine-containing dehydrogenase